MEKSKCVIYARFSSDKQREESIDGQIRECTAFAESNNLLIIGTYIDRAMSARTDKRPDFLRMIKDSTKRMFDYVIVYQLDRFSRSRYDSAVYKAKLKKNGVKVLSAKENIRDDPSGIILESVLEGYAEYYSAELSQKVRRGMMDNFLEKKWNGTVLPFGYALDSDRHMIKDEHTYRIISRIFDAAISGKTVRAIITELNDKGYRTSNGKRFTRSIIERLLVNPIYTGKFTWQGQTCKDFAPRLISDEQFNTMQALKNARKRSIIVQRRSDKYALTGKIYCGVCGLPMTGYSGKSHTGITYNYYRCSSKNNRGEKAKRYNIHCDSKNISRDELESLVLDTTVGILRNPDALHFIAEQATAVQAKEAQHKPAEQQTIECQIHNIQKKLKNCIHAVENGFCSTSIANTITKYENELTALNKELSVIKLKKNAFTITPKAVEYYLYQILERTKKHDKRSLHIFQDFIRRVVVTGNRVAIYYNYHNVPQILENPAVKILQGSNKDCLVTQ